MRGGVKRGFGEKVTVAVAAEVTLGERMGSRRSTIRVDRAVCAQFQGRMLWIHHMQMEQERKD